MKQLFILITSSSINIYGCTGRETDLYIISNTSQCVKYVCLSLISLKAQEPTLIRGFIHFVSITENFWFRSRNNCSYSILRWAKSKTLHLVFQLYPKWDKTNFDVHLQCMRYKINDKSEYIPWLLSFLNWEPTANKYSGK
jgi:hypothetical protein